MKKYLRQLARDYAETLKKYQADSQEAVLVEAYELGRQAIAKGLGVLEMVRVQHQALERFEWPAMKGEAKTDFLKLSEGFGVKAYRAATPEAFKAAFLDAMKQTGPVWIECLLSKNERVLPMIPNGGTVEDMIIG